MCPSIVDGFSRSKETCLCVLSSSAEGHIAVLWCTKWAEGILEREFESYFEALRPIFRLLFASSGDESMSELFEGSVSRP